MCWLRNCVFLVMYVLYSLAYFREENNVWSSLDVEIFSDLFH